MKTTKVIFITLGVILVLTVGVATGLYFTRPVHTCIGQDCDGQASAESPNTTTNPPAADNIVDQTDQLMNWNTAPKELSNLNFFDSNTVYGDQKYYDVGEFTQGKYKGGKLILFTGNPLTMSLHADYIRFVKLDSKYTLLTKYSDPVFVGESGDGPIEPKINYKEDNFDIPELDFPSILNGPEKNQKLKYVEDKWEMFDVSKYDVVFLDNQWGSVYTDKPSTKTVKNGFYLRAPDGTIRTYTYEPPFMGQDRIAKLTWADGTTNNDEYVSVERTGCGSFGYASVKYEGYPILLDTFVREGTVPPRFSSTELKLAGKTADGDDIYDLKDKNNLLLKDIYNNQYDVGGGESDGKLSYEKFLASHPVFFWKDPFDRWLKFQNYTFQPQAECGKPVIYLYPETTTDVEVTLNPEGGFTYTEPVYNNGWEVTAKPNGQLVEKTSGKTYPYLFWEGRGGLYKSPEKGFVVAQNDVHAFLVKSLGELGLNQKESADFIEFWEPRMTGSPYYFVSFYGTKVMDELAPLTVTPKPDTVIRILMDFSPLLAPIKVEPIKLQSIPRNGFTVVEWGGVLR
jgi:hypothetical protein